MKLTRGSLISLITEALTNGVACNVLSIGQ
jgi:hypothetical protein